MIRLPNSSLSLACETIPTAVHHAFLFFDAKAWPQYYTVGIPFCSSKKTVTSSTEKVTILRAQSHVVITIMYMLGIEVYRNIAREENG